MSIGLGQPVNAAANRLREWQRLNKAAIDEVMGHYLRGCADIAMARTPQEALAALHKTQSVLLRHSADTIAELARLWLR